MNLICLLKKGLNLLFKSHWSVNITLMSLTFSGLSNANFSAFFPAIILINVVTSLLYRKIGPIVKYFLKRSSEQFGKCPSSDSRPPVGLCPKTPVNIAGIRMEPPKSEQTPNKDAPLAIRAAF